MDISAAFRPLSALLADIRDKARAGEPVIDESISYFCDDDTGEVFARLDIEKVGLYADNEGSRLYGYSVDDDEPGRLTSITVFVFDSAAEAETEDGYGFTFSGWDGAIDVRDGDGNNTDTLLPGDQRFAAAFAAICGASAAAEASTNA